MFFSRSLSAPGISRGPFSFKKHGFVLPVVLILLIVLAILGISYVDSTIQSKNIYQVFYRDDLARLIAESAVNEWRATFYRRLEKDDELKKMTSTCGKLGNTVVLNIQSVPQTVEMAKRLVGSFFSLEGIISMKDCDDTLYENVMNKGVLVRKKSAAFGEYQGTLRFDIDVGLGMGKKCRYSHFVFEFDAKYVCLRSNPAERKSGWYSSTSTNDYVLFIRNAKDEFDQKDAASLNNDQVSVSISQKQGQGKFFFGCARKDDPNRATKFVFLNIGEGMEFMIPPNPPEITIGWDKVKEFMPLFAGELEEILRKAESESGGRFKAYPDRIKLIISREYSPISGSSNWVASLKPKTREMWNFFWKKANQSGFLKEENKQRAIDLFGGGQESFDYSKIEGNLRKRFWQTAMMRWDFSEAMDNPEYIEKVNTELGGEKGIQFLPKTEIESINNRTKEFYKLLMFHQETMQEPLMSQPNDRYAFVPGHQENKPNPEGRPPFPPLYGRTKPDPLDPVGKDYLPFAAYALRSYHFAHSEDLYKSRFYDPIENIIQLDGVMMFTDKTNGLHLGIPGRQLKYRGKGVLLSYGNIVIDGSFTKESPNDGPCIIYTYQKNIYANVREQGKIDASLIALNYLYNPDDARSFSGVKFSGKKVDVRGNIVADSLNIEAMKRLSDNSETNQVEYDSQALSGDTLFHFTLGGRLRNMSGNYNQSKEE